MKSRHKDITRCSIHSPCPICGHDSWCQLIGDDLVQCMRTEQGSFKTVRQSDGALAFLHRLGGGCYSPPPKNYSRPPKSVASVDQRDRVYQSLLYSLRLPSQHTERDRLRARGLTDEQIDKCGFGVFTEQSRKPWKIAKDLEKIWGNLLDVPGFVMAERDGNPYLTLALPKNVLLIPVRNTLGQIEAIKCRKAEGDPKYLYLSSKTRKWEGPRAVQSLHVPKGLPLDGNTIRVTEGPLKADVAWHLSGTPTVGLPAASSWKYLESFLKEYPNFSKVILSLDADFRSNNHVAHGLVCLYDLVLRLGREPILEVWDDLHGKGIDDVLLNAKNHVIMLSHSRTQEQITELKATQTYSVASTDGAPPNPPESGNLTPAGKRKPIILVTKDEMDVNDEIVASLADDLDLFTRANRLVRVLIEPERESERTEIRFPEGPMIAPVCSATLREHQSATAIYMADKYDKQLQQFVQKRVSPPHWTTQAVLERGVWPELRPLHAVIDYPFFLASGRFVCQRGYDPQSGIMYLPVENAKLRVPEKPNLEDARYAVEALEEGLVDFPFADPHHKAAWFAALLTPLVRFAIDGQAPLFLIEANAPGAGKGLLVDLISIILRGGKLPVSTYPPDPSELRKRVTALLLRGSTMSLFDNVSGNLGGQEIEALITSSTWSDRVLGQSSQVDLPMWVTWYATANNVNLVGDMARRVSLIRLESPLENPEERNDIQIKNLRIWAQQHRNRLLSAAVIILKAYFEAGCPDQNLPAWGSFEGWSRIVRNALVWVGLNDPWNVRKELRERADTETEAMKTMLRHWHTLDPENNGITVNQIVQFFLNNNPNDHLELVEAMTTLAGGKPDAQVRILSVKFRKYRRRNLGGYLIDTGTAIRGINRWVRYTVDTLNLDVQTAVSLEP